jgi:hypothetical protein
VIAGRNAGKNVGQDSKRALSIRQLKAKQLKVCVRILEGCYGYEIGQ